MQRVTKSLYAMLDEYTLKDHVGKANVVMICVSKCDLQSLQHVSSIWFV